MIPGKKPLHGEEPIKPKVIRRRPLHKAVLPGQMMQLWTEFLAGEIRAKLPFTSIEEETKFLHGTRLKPGEKFDPKKHMPGHLTNLEQFVPMLEALVEHSRRGPTTTAREKTQLAETLRQAKEARERYRKIAKELGQESTNAIKHAEERRKKFFASVRAFNTHFNKLNPKDRVSLLNTLLKRGAEYGQTLEITARIIPNDSKGVRDSIERTRKLLDQEMGRYAALLEKELKPAKHPKK